MTREALQRLLLLTATNRDIKKRKLQGTDLWYRASYNVFASPEHKDPSSATEFLHRVAYAYSWVATIAKADPIPHFVRVKSAVRKVRRAESQIPYSLFSVRTARENASIEDSIAQIPRPTVIGVVLGKSSAAELVSQYECGRELLFPFPIRARQCAGGRVC